MTTPSISGCSSFIYLKCDKLAIAHSSHISPICNGDNFINSGEAKVIGYGLVKSINFSEFLSHFPTNEVTSMGREKTTVWLLVFFAHMGSFIVSYLIDG
jgi:hypothetical protein